jgi:hypothetical protein
LKLMRSVVLSVGLLVLSNCKPKMVASVEEGSDTEALKVANADGSFDLFWGPALVPEGAVTAADNLMCFYSLKLPASDKNLLPKKNENAAQTFARLSGRIQQVNTVAGTAAEWDSASNLVPEFDDNYFIDNFLPKVESKNWVDSSSAEDRNVARLISQVAANLKSEKDVTCPPAPVLGEAFSAPAKADETADAFGASLPDSYKEDLKLEPESSSGSLNLAGNGKKGTTRWRTRGKRFACYATLGVCHAGLWVRDTLRAGADYANKNDRRRYERDVAQPTQRVYRKIGREYNRATNAVGNGLRSVNDWAFDNGRKLERVGQRAGNAGSKIVGAVGNGAAWGWNKFTTIFTGP